ncbi:hypothetical protein ACYOEI_33260 [Singulisphaera rosea]
MNESKDICDRCGESVTDEPSLILIESGPLHADRPRLSICAQCGESYQRWVDRRKEGSSRKSRKSKSSHSSSRSQKSSDTGYLNANDVKALQDRVRALIALSVALGVVLIIVIIVWALSM